ncbi:MAG: adenylate/guanylate cyclase domain-containing protein [Fuerstiella sp.]
MLILTAEGASALDKASWKIAEGPAMILGRHAASDLPVVWDSAVSRKHAAVQIVDSRLHVRCLPGSTHPLWKDAKSQKEATLEVGQSFRIGRTWFEVKSDVPMTPVVDIIPSGIPDAAHTTSTILSPADIRLAVVSENATALWTTTTEKQLAEEALRILHNVLYFAELLVVLSCENIAAANRPTIVHWHKNKSGVKASVSRELIAEAMKNSETAIEVESDVMGGSIKKGRWAFCVPVKSDAAVPWCIYVGGVFGEGADFGPFLTANKLSPDAGVTQLVAHLTGAIRSVRSLEDRFDGIRQFFSPRLLETVAGDNATGADLAPQETDIVAIYCDLRGFSKLVSSESSDLHGLLQRISAALGVMTQSIIEEEGVIADFQGDSALGFWGWPVALANGPIPACRAALKIQRLFRKAIAARDPKLAGFQVGIGIASGRAIAGRIGTRDHAKIGVFGPVVNVASRLEGLTKKVGAQILMDHETAAAVASHLSPEEGRCRPIGSLQPAGFDHSIHVSELLGPESESPISNDDIENFTDAVAAFQKGEWDKSRKLLGLLPADDRPRDFLLVQIASLGYQPPKNWAGTVNVDSK